MFFKIMVIVVLAIMFFYMRIFLKSHINKVFKSNKFIPFNKKNLNKWMNLTKRERYNISKQESINYLDKRKVLLEEIRKEYKEVSREKSKKNIKGK